MVYWYTCNMLYGVHRVCAERAALLQHSERVRVHAYVFVCGLCECVLDGEGRCLLVQL